MSIENLHNIWPEWTIERRLGKGSYGEVFQVVRRDHLETRAAVKVISIPNDQSEIDSLRSDGLSAEGTRTYLKGIVDDFVSEIQLMDTLKGVQNIVSVEDYKVVEKQDRIGWDIYIRMELLTPFNDYAQQHGITEADAIKLGIDICTALPLLPFFPRRAICFTKNPRGEQNRLTNGLRMWYTGHVPRAGCGAGKQHLS